MVQLQESFKRRTLPAAQLGSPTPLDVDKDIYELFPAARAVTDEVDGALQFKLTDIMFHRPPVRARIAPWTRSSSLAMCYPPFFATSVALLAVMRKVAGLDLKHDAAYVLGYSLGEHTALFAAG
ncbi:hypothetical protein GGF31_007479 [Allomyces arbusculus]|nr:hypothetical protein GGF31_007479 [Allomyces arbusculus]